MTRPLLYTSYKQDMALLDTRAKRVALLALLAAAAIVPLQVADDLLQLLAVGMVASIGAIGLNDIKQLGNHGSNAFKMSRTHSTA